MNRGSIATNAISEVEAETTAMPQPVRVCVVSENIGLPLNEGFRNFARSLISALGRRGPVLGISVGSSIDAPNTIGVKADKLFLSPRLRSQVAAFEPDLICYVPTASDTLFSLLRLRLLGLSCRRAAKVLVALQPRPHTTLGRRLIRRLAPEVLFVQSRKRVASLSHLGCPVRWLPSGVDLERFRPVSGRVKAALRAKYDLPIDAYLVLHVGHMTRERNVTSLEEIQSRWQVVMVAGRNSDEDLDIQRRLRSAGVIVFDQYMEAVEEIYQAADCFLFPVSSEHGSIEIPLSVMEAMACNLPVVSTRFGGLEDLVDGDREAGLLLADDPKELPGLVARIRTNGASRTRQMVQPFSWDHVAARLLRGVEEVVGKERVER